MKTTQYAVTGRVYGDDEDTLVILTLPATATRRDIAEAFKAEMRALARHESYELDEGEELDIYVNTIVKGDNLTEVS